LSYAAEGGHEAIAKLFLAQGNIDVNVKDKNGRTSLSHAAEGGHEAVVKLLLAQSDAGINAKDENSQTPLSHRAKWIASVEYCALRSKTPKNRSVCAFPKSEPLLESIVCSLRSVSTGGIRNRGEQPSPVDETLWQRVYTHRNPTEGARDRHHLFEEARRSGSDTDSDIESDTDSESGEEERYGGE
jgi:hypothetical protein